MKMLREILRKENFFLVHFEAIFSMVIIHNLKFKIWIVKKVSRGVHGNELAELDVRNLVELALAGPCRLSEIISVNLCRPGNGV